MSRHKGKPARRYIVRHADAPDRQAELVVRDDVMSRAANGDVSVRNNLCIDFRREAALTSKVEWDDLQFESLGSTSLDGKIARALRR